MVMHLEEGAERRFRSRRSATAIKTPRDLWGLALHIYIWVVGAALLTVYRHHQTPTPWYEHSVIAGTIAAHLEQQRLSYRTSPEASVIFDLAFRVLQQPRCAGLEALVDTLSPADPLDPGGNWFELGGAMLDDCRQSGLAAVSPDANERELLPQKIMIVEEDRLASVKAAIEPYSEPVCRSCSSRLLLVFSRDPASLDTTLSSLLDHDMRWTILRDVQVVGDGAFFALRYIPLSLQEQNHLNQFKNLQSSDISCAEQKFLVWELMGSGFGSVINSLARVSRFAVFTGRPLLVFPNPQFAYLDEEFCQGTDTLQCYFHGSLYHEPHRCLPYARDAISKITPLKPALATSHGFKMLDPVDRDPSNPFWLLEWPSWTGMNGSFNHFVYRQNLAFDGSLPHLQLANPRRRVRELLAARLAELPPSTRYIGMHVRHGDKSLETGNLVPFDRYMDPVLSLSRAHAVRDVYLATDNGTIVSQELSEYPLLRFTTQDVHRAGGVRGDAGWWRQGFSSKLELFLTSMVDIVQLSRADFFVGSHSSGFTQVVMSFRVAEQRFHNGGFSAYGKFIEETFTYPFDDLLLSQE